MKRPRWQFSTRKMMGLVVVFAGVSLVGRCIQVMREEGSRKQCINNFKSFMIAQHHYESFFGEFALGYQLGPPHSQQGLSWFVQLLPFLEGRRGNPFQSRYPGTTPPTSTAGLSKGIHGISNTLLLHKPEQQACHPSSIMLASPDLVLMPHRSRRTILGRDSSAMCDRPDWQILPTDYRIRSLWLRSIGIAVPGQREVVRL